MKSSDLLGGGTSTNPSSIFQEEEEEEEKEDGEEGEEVKREERKEGEQEIMTEKGGMEWARRRQLKMKKRIGMKRTCKRF